MSDYSDIVGAVETRLNTVANIGVVHSRTRFADDWATYLDNFKASPGGTDQILAWQVSIPEFNATPQRFGAIERQYRVEVFGVKGFSDSNNSEASFMALLESVLDALDFRIDLGASNVVDYTVGPASARYEYRMFGSVLCHAATIVLPVIVRKTASYA